MDADADVIVVGAGNAGMSAAQAAREKGASVLVLEKASREWSGGNSAFTAGAMRVVHDGVTSLRDVVEEDPRLDATDLPPYSAEEFEGDMRRVTATRRWRACSRPTLRTRSGGCTVAASGSG